MKIRNTILVALLSFAGCVSVSPDQAVNLSEVHEAVVRLMPYVEAGARSEIAALVSVTGDAARPAADRNAAAARIVSLNGILLQARLLPGVTAPIRDWAIAEVGTDAYAKAKASRDVAAKGAN